MIVIYQKLSEEELRKSAQETIPQVESWFANNPKRRVCKAELWYGKRLSIKRKNVAEQVNAVVNDLVNGE